MIPSLLALLVSLVVMTAAVQVVGSINERRVPECSALRESGPRLIRSAERHSREMAAAGGLYHTDLVVGRWSLVGEVVGVGSSWGQVVDMLFRSAPHRRILLDCRYDKAAVGIFRDDGQVWLTARLYAT